MTNGPYREPLPRATWPRSWRFATYCALALASGVPAGILARGVGATAYAWVNKPDPPEKCVEIFGRTPGQGYQTRCEGGGALEIMNNGEFYRCRCPKVAP